MKILFKNIFRNLIISIFSSVVFCSCLQNRPPSNFVISFVRLHIISTFSPISSVRNQLNFFTKSIRLHVISIFFVLFVRLIHLVSCLPQFVIFFYTPLNHSIPKMFNVLFPKIYFRYIPLHIYNNSFITS